MHSCTVHKTNSRSSNDQNIATEAPEIELCRAIFRLSLARLLANVKRESHQWLGLYTTKRESTKGVIYREFFKLRLYDKCADVCRRDSGRPSRFRRYSGGHQVPHDSARLCRLCRRMGARCSDTWRAFQGYKRIHALWHDSAKSSQHYIDKDDCSLCTWRGFLFGRYIRARDAAPGRLQTFPSHRHICGE